MEISVTDQKFINSGLYLDSKMQPVATINDLFNIPIKRRFVGMEVVVIKDNDGNMSKYWLEGGTKDKHWKRKSYGVSYEQGKGIVIKDGKISIDETYVVTNNNLENKLNVMISDTGSSVNKTITTVVNDNIMSADYFDIYK